MVSIARISGLTEKTIENKILTCVAKGLIPSDKVVPLDIEQRVYETIKRTPTWDGQIKTLRAMVGGDISTMMIRATLADARVQKALRQHGYSGPIKYI